MEAKNNSNIFFSPLVYLCRFWAPLAPTRRTDTDQKARAWQAEERAAAVVVLPEVGGGVGASEREYVLVWQSTLKGKAFGKTFGRREQQEQQHHMHGLLFFFFFFFFFLVLANTG